MSPQVILSGTTSHSAIGLQSHVLYLLGAQNTIMTTGLSYLPYPEQWYPILTEVMVKLTSQLPL